MDGILKIKRENKGNIQVLHVTGPVDSVNIDMFEEELAYLCNIPGRHSVVDCSGVTYLNHKSVRLMTHYSYLTYSKKGILIFTGVDEKLLKFFKQDYLEGKLLFGDTVNNAITVLQNSAIAA